MMLSITVLLTRVGSYHSVFKWFATALARNTQLHNSQYYYRTVQSSTVHGEMQAYVKHIGCVKHVSKYYQHVAKCLNQEKKKSAVHHNVEISPRTAPPPPPSPRYGHHNRKPFSYKLPSVYYLHPPTFADAHSAPHVKDTNRRRPTT